jgi:hypothetical protein
MVPLAIRWVPLERIWLTDNARATRVRETMTGLEGWWMRAAKPDEEPTRTGARCGMLKDLENART